MKHLAKMLLASLSMAAVAVLAFAAGIICAPELGRSDYSLPAFLARIAPPTRVEQDVSAFWEAWRVLDQEYYGKRLDQQTLLRGAIGGLINALDDPYSVYLATDQVVGNQSEVNGDLYGLGMAVEKRDDWLVVVAPLTGSPAHVAGIRPGDRILRINDRDTAALSLSQAVALLRGPAGSTLTLTILRPDLDILTITVERSQHGIPMVTGRILDDAIAYVNIVAFGTSTPREVYSFLQQVAANGSSRAIIVDIRNNPGGYIDAAVEVAGQFMTDGIVVSQQNRHGTVAWSYVDGGHTLLITDSGGKKAVSVRNRALAADMKTVVLVNQGTASAAEVLAAALQDHSRATLVGEPTYGKGTISGDYTLSDGSTIHLTNGQWFSPKGRNINGYGLTPDILVHDAPRDADTNTDVILMRAVQYILTGR